MLPFIIIGLASGAVYSLAGLSLVLTYKTSGVFNFALGALATVAAYVFYALYVLNGWDWPFAAAVAILVAGPAMGLVLELLARRIQTTTLALRVASTVGLLLVIEAAVELIYGTEQVRNVPTFLGTGSFTIDGAVVQVSQLVTLLFAIAVTVAMTVFLHRTRRGMAMRAVVDNPELLDLAGTSPVATRRLAWVIGCTITAASGVLFAPILSLDPVQLTLLIVSAFGAAALGRFTSLPWTLAGGLGIGVLASLCTKWFTSGLLAGLPPSLPFVVLFVVLLVFPKRHLVGPVFAVPRTAPSWTAPAALQLTGASLLIALLVAAPSFAGIHLTDWTTFAAMTIVFMSLSLLVRTSGQVSLSHIAFTAIGAAAFSHLTLGSGVPWLLALLLTGLVAVPIGALLAIPAIRLTGLYLALATFGFGILLQGMFYTQSYMFGSNGLGINEPRPHLSFLNVASDRGYYYVVVVIAVVVATAITVLTRSRLGRLLRGVAGSPVALQTSGTSINVTRVIVFCISAFLAAIGGALVAVGQTTVSADSYQPILSLTYFTVIIIIAGGTPWNAVLAAGALFLIPSYVSGSQVMTVLQLLSGGAAILYAIAPARRHTVPEPLRRAIDRTFGRIVVPLPSLGRKRSAPTAPAVPPGGIEVDHLEVRFRGLVAVHDLSLRAEPGRVTGLIGPNGAGKTTTFNACTGLIAPANGDVRIAGVGVSHRGPAARARLGLGRTFQRMELFEAMSVRDNVEAGAEGRLAGANPLWQIISRPGQRAAVRAQTDQALELCGLSARAEVPVLSLSTGQRRLVELARCLAGNFGLLLLDEPSSGLDRAETKRFGELLVKVVAERGIGILLVEHDMSLVLDICEDIYVLDFGELIFHGAPADVIAAPIVQAAYLGSTEVEETAR